MKRIITVVTDQWQEFVSAAKTCIAQRGFWYGSFLIVSLPVRLVIILVGWILHSIGAFLMGDFHDS